MMNPCLLFSLFFVLMTGCATHTQAPPEIPSPVPSIPQSSPARLKINLDKSVIDTTTNLLWVTVEKGKEFTWKECEGVIHDFSAASAHANFRLPSLFELKTLFDKENQELYQTRTFIVTGGPRVWSSTLNPSSQSVGYFNVSDGYSLFTSTNGDLKACILLVRPLLEEEVMEIQIPQ